MALARFVWDTLPEMHSCGAQAVTWACQGLDADTQFTISITDISVQQDAPLTSTASSSSTATGDTQISVNPTQTVSGALSRRTPLKRQVFSDYNGYGGTWLPRIDQDLTTTNVTPSSWTWPSVNVTQGWYVLVANIPSAAIQAQSSPFFVQNGTATVPCLAAASPSPSSISSSSPLPMSTSSTSASSTPTSANDTGAGNSNTSSRTNVGAIAGGVVGGIAFIAAVIAALFFFLCRRKRNLRARSAVGPGIPSKKPKRRGGERSESMQALPTKTHGSHSSSLASVAAAGPASEEGLTMREAYAAGTPTYTSAPPVSRRFSTQSASAYKPAAPYEGYSMGPLRSTSQPGAARDVPSALSIPTPSDEAVGGGPVSARRKPVPKYDVDEFGDDANTSTESGGVSASTDAAHYKRHSFVNAKPMQHFIQPDMPPDRQA